MCVTTVIENTANTGTPVLHQLSLHEFIKVMVCACAKESYYGLERWNSETEM